MNKSYGSIGLFAFSITIILLVKYSNSTRNSITPETSAKFPVLCDRYIATTTYYILPLTDSLATNKMIEDTVLEKVTLKLNELSEKIKYYNESSKETAQKEIALEFIEMCRSLSCCYLPKYQQEIKSKKFTKANLTNLKKWMIKINNWDYSKMTEVGISTPSIFLLAKDFTSTLKKINDYEKTIKK